MSAVTWNKRDIVHYFVDKNSTLKFQLKTDVSFSKINMDKCQRNVQLQYTAVLSSGFSGAWTARP